MKRWMGMLVMALAAACAGRQTPDHEPIDPPAGYESPWVNGISVITSEQAEQAGLVGRPVEVAFGDGEEPKAALGRLLADARDAGADHVSDVAIHQVVQKDGAWQDCVTRIDPVDGGDLDLDQEWVSHWRLEESEAICKPLARYAEPPAQPHLVRAVMYPPAQR